MDLSEITTVGMEDGILNLSRLEIGPSANLKAVLNSEITALVTALRQDVASGQTGRAAIPLAWENDELVVTLTIAGDADNVVSVLQQISTVVDPTKPSSDWIESLCDLIKATTPAQRSEIMWDDVFRGVLQITRTGTAQLRMQIPTKLEKELLSSGKLKNQAPPMRRQNKVFRGLCSCIFTFALYLKDSTMRLLRRNALVQ